MERASRGCARADLPAVEWDVSADRLAHYLGRPADPKLEAELQFGTWRHPHEDIDGGCPGSWRRLPIVADVVRFARKRTGDGGRVPNPFFDRLADDPANDLLLEAVMFFEAQEDAAIGHWKAAQAEEARARARALGRKG